MICISGKITNTETGQPLGLYLLQLKIHRAVKACPICSYALGKREKFCTLILCILSVEIKLYFCCFCLGLMSEHIWTTFQNLLNHPCKSFHNLSQWLKITVNCLANCNALINIVCGNNSSWYMMYNNCFPQTHTRLRQRGTEDEL